MIGPSTGHQTVLSSVKSSTLCVAGSCVHYCGCCLAYIVEVAIGLFVEVRLFLTANCSRDELCLFVVTPIAFSSLSVLIVFGLPLIATMWF